MAPSSNAPRARSARRTRRTTADPAEGDSPRVPARRRGRSATPSSGLVVSVVSTPGAGRGERDLRGLDAWLAATAPSSVRGEVSLALVGDARMRSLNRRFRGVDRTTDVLSFPADPRPADPPARPPAHPPATTSGLPLVGDIVIALGLAERQARTAGHSLQTELRVLALHGLLHLAGYDHERADDRGRMRRVEDRLRRKGGLAAGLIGRMVRPK